MPLYEYECPRTGKRFEVIQKFSDDPITRCEDCDDHADCDGEARKLLADVRKGLAALKWEMDFAEGKIDELSNQLHGDPMFDEDEII